MWLSQATDSLEVRRENEEEGIRQGEEIGSPVLPIIF